MLNGNVLKICFLMIVGTFCFILLGLTLGVAFKKIEIPMYVQLLGELGVSGLFGSIIQAFIHANIGEQAIKQSNGVPEATTASKTGIPEAPKT